MRKVFFFLLATLLLTVFAKAADDFGSTAIAEALPESAREYL